MIDDRRYLVCPQRPGSPRVALEVCRICPKGRRCAAWRDYACPALFPGLDTLPPRAATRIPRTALAAKTTDTSQASLPMAGL